MALVKYIAMRFLTIFFVFLFVFLFKEAKSEEIMFWMVDESANVDNIKLSEFLMVYPEDDDHWSAVRIKVTGPGIGTRYLDNLNDLGGGWEAVFPAEEGVALSDAGDGYGISTGNWGTQSPLALDGIDQELFGEAKFQVELGYLTWNEVLDVVDWITLAETDPIAKSALSDYLYERGTLMPDPQRQWVPTDFHTIPEPSTGILALVGMALLMLKRKKVA